MEIAAFCSFIDYNDALKNEFYFPSKKIMRTMGYFNKQSSQGKCLFIDLDLSAPRMRKLFDIEEAKKTFNDYRHSMEGRHHRIKNINQYLARDPDNQNRYFLFPDETLQGIKRIMLNLTLEIQADVISERLQEIFNWCANNEFKSIIILCPTGFNGIFNEMLRMAEKKIITKIFIVPHFNAVWGDINLIEELIETYPKLPITLSEED